MIIAWHLRHEDDEQGNLKFGAKGIHHRDDTLELAKEPAVVPSEAWDAAATITAIRAMKNCFKYAYVACRASPQWTMSLKRCVRALGHNGPVSNESIGHHDTKGHEW